MGQNSSVKEPIFTDDLLCASHNQPPCIFINLRNNAVNVLLLSHFRDEEMAHGG